LFSHRIVLTAATALAATALLLTGCSAGAGSQQSTKQACKVLQTGIESSSTDLSTAFSNIQSDPAGAEKSLAKFDVALKAATAKVTNAKVKSAATKTTTAVDAMDSDLKKYVEDSSETAGLQKSATKVQTTFTTLGKLCTP
jgi:PBP1b-binding outer membrane lipoprotein LpoB